MKLSGSILVILAAICFGFMGLFRSWADEITVEMTMFLRFLIAGTSMVALVTTGWRLQLRGFSPARRPALDRRTLPGLIAMGGLCGILYVAESMSFFHAMNHIPVGMVSLLLYVYPAIVTIFAWLYLSERLTRSRLTALALAATGLALTIGPTAMLAGGLRAAGSHPLLGVALGLGCCLSYASYVLIGGNLARRAGALNASTVVMLTAACVFGVIVIARGDHMPISVEAWAGVALLAIVCTVVPVTCVLIGLQTIGPVQTSTLSTMEPIATIVIGAAFMHQSLSAVQLIGGGMIVMAAIIVARSATAPLERLPTSADVLDAH